MISLNDAQLKTVMTVAVGAQQPVVLTGSPTPPTRAAQYDYCWPRN